MGRRTNRGGRTTPRKGDRPPEAWLERWTLRAMRGVVAYDEPVPADRAEAERMTLARWRSYPPEHKQMIRNARVNQ